MHDFETSVKLHYDELTEAEQEMTRYILNNRELVSRLVLSNSAHFSYPLRVPFCDSPKN